MDHDFGRTLLITIAAGLFIVGTGTVLLIFVFRAVAEGKRSEARYLGLALGLVLFVFICCALFFALSFR